MIKPIRRFAKQTFIYLKQKTVKITLYNMERNEKTKVKVSACLFLPENKGLETRLHFFPDFTSWTGELLRTCVVAFK